MARQAGVSEALKVAHKSGVGATVGAQMTPEEGIDAGIIAANGKEPVAGSAMKGEDAETRGAGAPNLRGRRRRRWRRRRRR